MPFPETAGLHRLQVLIGEVREMLRGRGLGDGSRGPRQTLPGDADRRRLIAYGVELEDQVGILTDAGDGIAGELRKIDRSAVAANAYRRAVAQLRTPGRAGCE